MPPAPQGRITRGTTGPNRLRRFDRWIAHLAARELRCGTHPLVVDLGFGASPRTVTELQHRLPMARVIGVEIDRERVRAALDLGIPAVHGGFEVPVPERPLVIRAANVLRQYDVAEVPGAWAAMCSRLQPDGWLVEGTCDELGRLAVFISLDAGARPHWLTLSCRLAGLDSPTALAARLPKALIERNVPGEPIHRFLTDLAAAWQRAPRWGARQRWVSSAAALAASGWTIRDGPGRWRLGELTVAANEIGLDAPLPRT